MKTDSLCQKAALEYIKHGFPVIPLCWPNIDGTCGCGHKHQDQRVGKAPLTEHGLNDKTQIQPGVKEYWEQRWPRANVGIVIPPGYFVLDVDLDHKGFESLPLLEGKVGKLPATWEITTGSGGFHLWYKTAVPIRNTVTLAGFKGIDVRGQGGYVVAPPSVHRNGRKYEVAQDLPIAAAPQALIDLCTKKQATAQLDRLLTESGSIAEGERNQTLASLAGSMRSRGMPESAIEAALLEVNRLQCQPPLLEIEVRKIAKSVARYAPSHLKEFFQAPNAVFKLDMNKHEKLVYLYLCRCTNQGTPAFPGYGNIAKSCSMSRPIAVQAIKSLEEKGRISKTRRPKSNKGWESNTYHVLPLPP